MKNLTEEEIFLDRVSVLLVRERQKEEYKKSANELVETLESEEVIKELLCLYEAQKERIKELEDDLELIKKQHIKSHEIRLAESVLMWFIVKATDYKIIDNKPTQVLYTFDDWEFGQGQSGKPLYRKIIRNAFKVLAAQAPENSTYTKAKAIWDKCPTFFESSRVISAPMGDKK